MTANLKKTGVIFALVALLSFGLVMIGTAQEAHAATTDNTSYSFSMPKDGTAATAGRDKNNTSPIYVKISKINGSCRMYVDGRKSGTSWTNCTVNGYAKATKVGKWCIRSTVHESGYGYARLTAWAKSNKSSVSGAWSPDSKGSYTAINAK